MDRFDKFTDEARKVLTLAQDEAQRFDHNYIGTEHLLLGLVRQESGVAVQVLRNLGAEPTMVRTATEFILGRGDRPVVGEVGLTPRAKRVIELAIDEARRLDHHYIGTEHLLIGLVREGQGVAAGVLESMGISLDMVRHEVVRFLSERAAPDSRALETARRVIDVEESPLQRVVGIGLAGGQGIDDISLELIALEIRAAGCVLHWKAHFVDEPLYGGPELSVTDDLGTEYSPRSGSWYRSGREARGQLIIVPALPDDASALRLELRITSLKHGRAPGESSLGAEVSLRD